MDDLVTRKTSPLDMPTKTFRCTRFGGGIGAEMPDNYWTERKAELMPLIQCTRSKACSSVLTMKYPISFDLMEIKSNEN